MPSASFRHRNGTISSTPSLRTSSSRSTRFRPSTGSESRKLGDWVERRVRIAPMPSRDSCDSGSPAPVRATGPSAVSATM